MAVLVGGRQPGHIIMADEVKLPRGYCEALIRTELSGHQRRVLDVMILKTIGDHGRPSISISSVGVSKACDLSQSECGRMMKSLVDRNILRAAIPPRGGRKGIYKVNLNVKTWLERGEQTQETGTELAQPVIKDGMYREAREKIVEAWFDGFYFCTRENYPFTGRDGALVRTMLTKHGYTADQLIMYMALFFELWSEDEWMQRTGALTLQFFYTKLPSMMAMKATRNIDIAEAERRRERWAELRARSRRPKRG